jgi:hypothetical protein
MVSTSRARLYACIIFSSLVPYSLSGPAPSFIRRNTQETCTDESSYRLSVNGIANEPCSWIDDANEARHVLARRQEHCSIAATRNACKRACGECCGDNNLHTFNVFDEIDLTYTSVTCSWLTQNQQRRDFYCGSKGLSCPSSCGYCTAGQGRAFTTMPTKSPSKSPSRSPSKSPSMSPTMSPTNLPSMIPTAYPSVAPSSQPSSKPSSHPSSRPSFRPSILPETGAIITNEANEREGEDARDALAEGGRADGGRSAEQGVSLYFWIPAIGGLCLLVTLGTIYIVHTKINQMKRRKREETPVVLIEADSASSIALNEYIPEEPSTCSEFCAVWPNQNEINGSSEEDPNNFDTISVTSRAISSISQAAASLSELAASQFPKSPNVIVREKMPPLPNSITFGGDKAGTIEEGDETEEKDTANNSSNDLEK